MSEPGVTPLVDAQHPWLGLLPFKDAHRQFFFGRDAEITEILGRIRENTLTVLFGQSGLGKTSLLGAAVVPSLRDAALAPVLLRLDYEASAPSLLEQTRAAFRLALSGAAWPEDPRLTLWEIFHRLPAMLPADAPAPVLIFDQFEEIFTLGSQNPAREREAEQWLEEMADLLQNRPPRPLEERFAENRRLAREFDFGPSPLRLVFALREDYLSHLEGWKTRLPLLTQNRMALHLLNGPQALEAVLGPASLGADPLLSREVAASIVRTVARVPAETPLPQIKAVPPLLSLLCEQLNAARLAAGAGGITAAMVTGQSADILQRFYEESFAIFPAGQREIIREVVEDRMVTVGGHRHPVAREDAEAELAARAVPEPRAAFDALIQRRLLTAEEYGGLQRLEVTHDVLVPLLVRSRKERRDRVAKELAERALAEEAAKTRRRRALTAAMAALSALALAGGVYGLMEAHLARSAAEKANAATVEAQKQAGIASERANEAVREKAGALALIRFMDVQVGETFTNVSVQLRERVSDRLDEFYLSQAEPTSFEGRQRRMGYHIRRALIQIDAAEDLKAADLDYDAKNIYIAQELESAAAELGKALAYGDSLAAKEPDNRAVTRDRILTHYHLSALAAQRHDPAAATGHLRDARELLNTIVKDSPFSEVLWADWMGLPDLAAAMGDRAMEAGDRAGAQAWYQQALALQTRLAARLNAGELSKTGVKRLLVKLHELGAPDAVPATAGDAPTAAPPSAPLPLTPFANDLEMRFVPVKRTNVFFSIYQTRVRDFRVFMRETGYAHMRETTAPISQMWSLDTDGRKQRGRSWDDPGFSQSEDHPVVGVSWYDAKAFCEWLTLRERAAGRLPTDWEYRLPTDAEWSVAVGLDEEDPKKTPREKDGKIKDKFPWGIQWPPPAGAGNYAGDEVRKNGHWPPRLGTIPGYDDGFPRTAPVNSDFFKVNQCGLYELGSNVVEWCEEEFDSAIGSRVVRGASWRNDDRKILLSSARGDYLPGSRYDNLGFRCVVGVSPP